jgi:hypothetical protein
VSEIRKIKTFWELDELLPFILKLRKKSGAHFPVTGFIGWLANAFFLPTTLVLGIYGEDNRPIGYGIATIENNYGAPECCIVDAYMDERDNDATRQGYNQIVEWAHEFNVTRLVCYTMIPAKLSERYGFWPERTKMTKEI